MSLIASDVLCYAFTVNVIAIDSVVNYICTTLHGRIKGKSRDTSKILP